MEQLVSETNVVALLRAAAQELLPVVIELGPERARFSSFVTAVDEHEGAYALLDPVADDLPSVFDQPFRIASTAGPGWFIVAHEIERVGPRSARVELTRARVFGLANSASEIAVPATDLLVMVVPGGLHGSSAYVFPVQRIGPEFCEIRSSVALEPGRSLDRVEIIGDRRLLRRASAQVLETVPWYLPDGSRNFSCKLSLNDEDPDKRNQSHDLVIDAAEVRRLLEFAGIMHADGWFEAPGWGRGPLRFLEIGKDSARLELLSSPQSGSAVGSVRIGVKLFAISYEFDVRALSFEQGQMVTSLPLILKRRRRHRRDHRVPVEPPHEVNVTFRNPITGISQTQRVNEISFFGLSFESDDANTSFWRGLPLEHAQLAWRNCSIDLGDLIVEQIASGPIADRAHCSASITNAGIADDLDMISLITTLAHPSVRTHDGSDFSALHQTYLKAGLFGPHMDRNLEPIMEQTKRVWHTLHCDAGDVARTFVHGPKEAPDAAVTVLRAWEHAWVAQHLVDISPELTGASGRIQNAYLDYLVPRPDGRYLLFFVKTENRIMNAYVRRFIESMGTPEAVTRTTVELWLSSTKSQRRAAGRSDIEVRACCAEDELVLGRATDRCYGAASAAALSMRPGQLWIPDTRRRFERAALERSRDCAVVTRGGEPAFGLVEERLTPGVNLTWMLNATWIVPIHEGLDSDGHCLDAALQSVVDKPSQSPTGERFLNLPEGMDERRLHAWGFVKEASLYLYVFTRAGLHRYFHYTASRYGELDVLAARRERRRAKQSGRDHE